MRLVAVNSNVMRILLRDELFEDLSLGRMPSGHCRNLEQEPIGKRPQIANHFSVLLTVWVFVCLYVSIPLFVCLSHLSHYPVSVSDSLYLCLCLCLFSPSVSLSPSMYLSLFLLLPQYLFSLTLSFSLCFSISLPLFVCLCLFLSS